MTSYDIDSKIRKKDLFACLANKGSYIIKHAFIALLRLVLSLLGSDNLCVEAS